MVPRCAENSDVAWFTFKADASVRLCKDTQEVDNNLTYSN